MGINGHIILCEDYVSFEVAKLLKEKGFNEKCRTFYNDKTLKITYIDSPISNEKPFNLCLLAPTLQMAMKWLREVHKQLINVWYDGDTWSSEIYRTIEEDFCLVGHFQSYEEAAEAAIKYCLTNLI